MLSQQALSLRLMGNFKTMPAAETCTEKFNKNLGVFNDSKAFLSKYKRKFISAFVS